MRAIIDCDPGCDDAMALLLAFHLGHSKIEEVLITTVAGNVSVDDTTKNAARMVAYIRNLFSGKKLPKVSIHQGSAKPLVLAPLHVESVHGSDGLGDVPDPRSNETGANIQVTNIGAVELLTGLASEDGSYDLVCTGPLTNLAHALRSLDNSRDLLDKFNSIVVMGGAFHQPGNITPFSEFNFYFDPDSVQVVLDCLRDAYGAQSEEKIVFVPLDITERVQLRAWEIEDKRSPRFMSMVLGKYFAFHNQKARALTEECASANCGHSTVYSCQFLASNDGVGGFSYLHDPLAMYFALNNNASYTSCEDIRICTDDPKKRGNVVVNGYAADSGNLNKAFTRVRYMDPSKVPVSYIKQFKAELIKACNWQPQSQKT